MIDEIKVPTIQQFGAESKVFRLPIRDVRDNSPTTIVVDWSQLLELYKVIVVTMNAETAHAENITTMTAKIEHYETRAS